MAALMNVIREELTVATTGAISSTTAPVTSTMSRSIMTAVRQDVVSNITESTSILREATVTDGASLLPKSALQEANSPRELISQAVQQGLESVGDSLLDKGAAPKV
ncbi:hypothetical protein CPB86DRAFT_749263 [Serendipita vermifera]|nr:hypothetical protein CPB86DRAFT_749263 [Serendipita vermifera]